MAQGADQETTRKSLARFHSVIEITNGHVFPISIGARQNMFAVLSGNTGNADYPTPPENHWVTYRMLFWLDRAMDPRTPCLVGAAQYTGREQPGPEPLDLWESVARDAAREARRAHRGGRARLGADRGRRGAGHQAPLPPGGRACRVEPSGRPQTAIRLGASAASRRTGPRAVPAGAHLRDHGDRAAGGARARHRGGDARPGADAGADDGDGRRQPLRVAS